MKSNMNIFDFELTTDEMSAIDAMNSPTGGWGLPKPQNIQ